MLAEHIRNLRKEIETFKSSNEFNPLRVSEPQDDPQYLRNDPQERTIEEIILFEIRKNNKITREELAEITQSSVSTIKRRLKKMNNIVIYKGSGYSGHWEIIESKIKI